MIHDPALLDYIAQLPVECFDGIVFRATGITADPTAPSTNGGRWAPPDVSVLYTCLERDGAIAEVVSYLLELTPVPKKPLRVHQLEVSTRKTLRFARGTLEELGVDMGGYGVRDYQVTQRIGAAIAFLERDGLISPSARWECDNLTIFGENHSLDEKLSVVAHEDVDWNAWARANGLV